MRTCLSAPPRPSSDSRTATARIPSATGCGAAASVSSSSSSAAFRVLCRSSTSAARTLLGAARLGRSRGRADHARQSRGQSAGTTNIRPPAGDATDLADTATGASTSRSATRSSSTSSRSKPGEDGARNSACRRRLLGADTELLVPDRTSLPRAGLALAARGHPRGDPAAPRRRLGRAQRGSRASPVAS